MTADLLFLFLLLVANGLFAMAEIALVASRPVRLEQRRTDGNAGAGQALRLKTNPTDFLSTVQVGITLIGILAGAYSGSRLAAPLAEVLRPMPVIGPHGDTIAFALVVSALTFFSLIIGELVPKAIALRDPETIAALVARPFNALAWVAAPLVRLLSAATTVVLWVLRIRPGEEPHATEEEIRALIKQATRAGELAHSEQQLVERVFHLDDRRVSSIMTPRHEIAWIDVEGDETVVRDQLASYHHSRVIVCQGELDRVVGICKAEDLLAELVCGRSLDLRALVRLPLFVPETVSVLSLLERFRTSHVHTALVIDEYGAIQGLVTISDILEGLFGATSTAPAGDPGPVVRRDDGSYLVDGSVSLDDLQAVVPLPPLDPEEEGQFQTVAGLVMTRLSRVPRVGDQIQWGPVRFEVMDMDDRRVDKVLVVPAPKQSTTPPTA